MQPASYVFEMAIHGELVDLSSHAENRETSESLHVYIIEEDQCRSLRIERVKM